MMDDEKANANSELRFIALELTKISISKKKPFRAVANEFVANVFELEGMLKEATSKRQPAKGKRSAQE